MNKSCKKKLEQEFWTGVEQKLRTKIVCKICEQNFEKRLGKSCEQNYEQKLWKKLWKQAVNKSCEQKLWTKDVNKSFEQKLQTQDINPSKLSLTTLLAASPEINFPGCVGGRN